MAEDAEKAVPLGFEGITVDEPQPAEQPATSSKAGRGEEIQLLTPDEQAVQLCALALRGKGLRTQRVQSRRHGKAFPGRFLAVASSNGFPTGRVLMAYWRFVNT